MSEKKTTGRGLSLSLGIGTGTTQNEIRVLFCVVIMKVLLHYNDTPDESLHKTIKITLPKSWKIGPVHQLLEQFVETYNDSSMSKTTDHKLNVRDLHLVYNSKALASDAVVIDILPDRADVYIAHGASQTLEEMNAIVQEKLLQEQKLKANLVKCTHFGCNKSFSKGGPYPECKYHAKPPVFHETAKFWSCCPNSKAYDWETFQSIPGCCEGTCSEIKEDGNNSKLFLGGCDLREELSNNSKLKSIEGFNQSSNVLRSLRQVLCDIDEDNGTLYDQVVEGMRADNTDNEEIVNVLGKKIKDVLKEMVREKLRIQ